jgi:hypothetical protein
MLALVYFGGIAVLQGLFRALGGGESQLAVVASTLLYRGASSGRLARGCRAV